MGPSALQALSPQTSLPTCQSHGICGLLAESKCPANTHCHRCCRCRHYRCLWTRPVISCPPRQSESRPPSSARDTSRQADMPPRQARQMDLPPTGRARTARARSPAAGTTGPLLFEAAASPLCMCSARSGGPHYLCLENAFRAVPRSTYRALI